MTQLPSAGPPEPAAHDERRLVTVLFGDIVGFTTIAETLDPEDLKRITDRCLKILADQVTRFEGSVDKFEGDLIMAVFGAPVAHEDDAERAVLAALNMQQALGTYAEDLKRRRGLSVSMRIGINTGEVVSGAVGSRRAKDYTVMGDVVNTASRLEGLASPGTVLVGASTHALTRHLVEFEAREPILVRGKAEPVPVFRALGLRPERGPRRGIEGLSAPLVGRDAALETLDGHLSETARTGRPRLVTVLGPAGIGKTRLLEAFRARAEAAGAAEFHRGHCLPYGQVLPFHPLVQIVREVLDLSDSDHAPLLLERLGEWVPRLIVGERAAGGEDAVAPEAQLVTERLAAAMGSAGASDSLGSIDPANLKYEFFWAWARLLSAWAARGPLALVVEDVHLADPLVLDCILAATESVEGPLLFLCTSRPDLLEARPQWAAQTRHALLRMEPLAPDESLELVDHLLQPNLLSGEGRSRIVRATGGIPLFIEECLRALIDDRRLVRGRAGWVTPHGEQLPDLPDSLFGLVSARIDRLGLNEKAVVQRAAVVGPVFWESSLSYPAAQLSDEFHSLLELKRRGWISPSPDSRWGSDLEYVFTSPVVREAAYRGLTRARRSQEHLRVAGWLEGKLGDQPEGGAGLLAYHLSQGVLLAFDDEDLEPGVAERAFACSWEAAEQARDQHAFAEALTRYDAALALLDRLPDGAGAAERRVDLLLGRARVMEPLGRAGAALEDLSAALAEPAIAGWPARAGAAHTQRSRLLRMRAETGQAAAAAAESVRLYEDAGDPAGLALALLNLGEVCADQARFAEFERHARRAADIAAGAGTGWVEGRALSLVGTACLYQGRFAEAEVLLRRSADVYEGAGDRRGLASSCLLLARAQHARGAGSQAAASLELAYRSFQEMGDQFMRVGALTAMAQLAIERGALAEARDDARRGAGIAEALGLVHQAARCLILLGHALLELGEPAAARQELERALALGNGTDLDGVLPEVHRLLALAQLAIGDTEEAERSAARASAAAGPADDYSQGTALLALARVHAAQGRPADAGACFDRALESLVAAGEAYELGEAHLEYARFLRGQRVPAAAIMDHLDAALAALLPLESAHKLAQVAQERADLEHDRV